jgi:hypothetical protein
MRRQRTERGASLVEFALLVPIMALLVFGIIEFGLAFSDSQNLRQATREGNRLITVNPSDFVSGGAFDDAKLRTVIVNEAGLTDSATRLHVSWSPTGTLKAGDDFTVCATYELRSHTLLLGPFIDGKSLRSVSHLRFEQDMPVPITASTDSAAPSCSGTSVGPTTTVAGATTTTTDPCVSDTTGPTVTTFSSPVRSAVTNIALTINASDPRTPLQMQFSNDGTTFSGFAAYATSSPWTLTAGDGTKTITMQIKDSCGNVTTRTTQTILDTVPPPNPTVSGSSPKNNEVDIVFSDTEAGVTFECNVDGGAFSACTSPQNYKGPGFDGSHVYGVRARDEAGNASGTVTTTVSA